MSKTGSDIVFQENLQRKSPGSKYPEFSLNETLSAFSFHRSMPSYEKTPLHQMKGLADYLGIESLWIKDESRRFRLNSFKALGASYALGKWLMKKTGQSSDQPTFDRMIWWFSNLEGDFSLVTATDGNHGCGVAWLASVCGCKAKIFVPSCTSEPRIANIEKLGAEVIVVDGNYDKAVRVAQRSANDGNSLFIQDTTTEQEETVPEYIMQGYLTLIHETYDQLPLEERPTHILLQAGVGSFAAAAQAYISNRFGDKGPRIILVEPEGAACFYESFKRNDGDMTCLDDYHSVMAGLSCGRPNRLAWRILKGESEGVLRCHDRVSYLGMRVLHQPLSKDAKIISGESGAVGLGALFKICKEAEASDIREKLGLDQSSKVLLISTEGATDPDGFRKGLWEDL